MRWSGGSRRHAYTRIAAGPRTLLGFGARRMHPAPAPVIERAACLGGCDGASATVGAERLGTAPTGTMPRALTLAIGDRGHTGL